MKRSKLYKRQLKNIKPKREDKKKTIENNIKKSEIVKTTITAILRLALDKKNTCFNNNTVLHIAF